jgi:hypothetical protein
MKIGRTNERTGKGIREKGYKCMKQIMKMGQEAEG